ncbi:MAG: hypothetical protein JSV63_04320 [Candidatus Aenigmatarchaeota archaeon]|nr:MAG: hypothetical protein JSV63_04320 [Candidatus Aenigmarchaeota archaeon]
MDKGKMIILIVSIAVILSFLLIYSNYSSAYMVPFIAPEIGVLSWAILLFGWIFLVLYVPHHARKNGYVGWRMTEWMLLTLFFSGLGGLLYVSGVIKPKTEKVKK